MKDTIFLISRLFSNNVEIQVGAVSSKEKAEKWLIENYCKLENYKIKEVVFYG